jgi:DNA-3-methyladenine glycosylase II
MRGASTQQIDIEAALMKADPELGRVIKAIIARIGPLRVTRSRASPFEALAWAIVYQSVAAKAADTIFARLRQTSSGDLTPAAVLELKPESLRAIGLSTAKARYIRNLAEWFSANPNIARKLTSLADKEVIQALTGISGIGVWTANVFLIFSLGRLDVVPADDLGIRRGVQLAYRLKSMATPEQVHDKALLWRPYRSIASMYLWNAVKLKINANDLMEEQP